MSEKLMGEWQSMPIPEAVTEPLVAYVNQWVLETRTLLPGIPDDLTFEWDNNGLITEIGCGGGAITPRLIRLAFDPDFYDKDLQM